MIHEKEKQREHIFEKLWQKLSAQELAKIQKNLLSKIKVANQCKNQILEETSRLLVKITNSCMRALDAIEEKKNTMQLL